MVRPGEVLRAVRLLREYPKLESMLDEVKRKLIPWMESQVYEIEAERVFCITPNLVWAAGNAQEIAAKLIKEKSRKHWYIVFKNGHHQDAQAAVKNAETLLKAARLAADDQLCVVFLTNDADLTGCIYRVSDVTDEGIRPPSVQKWMHLPLPTDLVIYENTIDNVQMPTSRTRTFGVMSVKPIGAQDLVNIAEAVAVSKATNPLAGKTRDVAINSVAHEYDLQISSPDHCARIKAWFIAEWKRMRAPHARVIA